MKKLSIVLSVLIIIGCLGYIAYDRITDFMVKKTLTLVAEDEQIKAHIDAVLEDVVAPEPIESPAPSTEGEEPQNSGAPEATAPVDNQGRSAAAFPTAPPKTPAPKQSGGLSMDSLEGSDKSYVMSIYNRFTASEVSTVSSMLSGGLTVEEKRAIKSIVYAKVSGAEIDRLYAIARKYQ